MPMRDTVKQIFYGYTAAHEGIVPYMYADKKNLVTTGVGNILDQGKPDTTEAGIPIAERDVSAQAMAPALALPWKHRGIGWTRLEPVATTPASKEEIIAAWKRVKQHPCNGRNPAAGFAYENVTDLTLDLSAMHALFWGGTGVKMAEAGLTQYYPKWESWPADAQLAMLTMAWGLGDKIGKDFPALREALNASPPNFLKAADEVHYKDGNGRVDGVPGTSPNERNRALMLAAANTQEGNWDYDVLHVNPPVPVKFATPDYEPSIADLIAKRTQELKGTPEQQLASQPVFPMWGVGLAVAATLGGLYLWRRHQQHRNAKGGEE